MSRRCYLHVGMHKTGSSAIQNALIGYDDGQIEYLKLRAPNHSVPLVSAVMPDLHNYPQVKKQNLTREQLEDLKIQSRNNLSNALQQSPGKDVVISAEYFSHPGMSAKQNLFRLKGILQQYFDEIRVIAYVRSPKSFMESALQERIKGGESRIALSSLYPHYRSRLEKFDDFFGEESVTILEYDASSFENDSVVIDFCRQVGVSLDSVKSVSSNEKMGFEAMALLYTYNLFRGFVNSSSFQSSFSNKFMADLKSLSATGFSLAESVVHEALSNNQDDLAWIERRKGGPFNHSTGTSSYTISSLDDLVSFVDSSVFYTEAKNLPAFSDNIIRPDLFEAFVTNYQQSSFSLDRAGFNSLKNASTKPVVAFRELAKALFESGLVIQSKLVLDLASKEYPGAKALQKLRKQVSTALDDLGMNNEKSVKKVTESSSHGQVTSQPHIKLLSQEKYASMYEPFRESSKSLWLKEKTSFLSAQVDLDRVIQRIECSYQSKSGLSIVRSGDGEGSFLARYLSGFEMELFYLCARGSLRLHFGHQNYKYDDLNFWANEIYSAFVSSDIITSARDESSVERLLDKGHGLDFRSMVGQIAGSIVPYSIAQQHGNEVYSSGYLHRDLIPYYHELLKGKKVVIIGPNDESFADDFASYFNCTVTDVITIPGQYVVERGKLDKALYPFYYQSVISKLYDLDLRGKICLVGAGLAGKVFCSKIGLHGGIGLDVGSMMDAWGGKKARKYHTSEFLDASSVHKS